ncbi:MAG: tRNA 2-thiouridine(34) synthase MnmA [Deltaproteobacteria bacterium]|nr:tRNA 2-thiouridine(34) synthase MnmA [Deltaproteobacteria bacterium]
MDSSVAAAMLAEAGCDVVGITLSLWEDPDPNGPDGGCCTPDDILDARRVCRDLGVPHYLLNYRAPFAAQVIEPFVKAYQQGLTPNPCVRCNNHLKFDRLMDRAAELDAHWVATGHYAQVVLDDTGRARLLAGVDPGKDQSYFLGGTTRPALDRLCMPLGGMTKAEVRAEAERLEVRTRNKPDSQDICFIPDGDVAGFVSRHGGAGDPGAIVDEEGRVLGTHQGVHSFTVGQRKGLGIASAEPLYVREIDAGRGRLVVASAERLGATEVSIEEWSWLRRPAADEPTSLKVRYRGGSAPVDSWTEVGTEVEAVLRRPVRSLAPGQAAVLYGAGSEVLGGGTVARARASRSSLVTRQATAPR